MIPMSELIKDPTYRKFLETKPQLPPIMRDPKRMSSPPWVVYIQRKTDGPWGKKEFWKYSQALKFFGKAVLKHHVHDAALNCKRMGFDPPSRMVRIKGKFIKGSDGKMRQATKRVTWKLPTALELDQPEHHWCLYCRRPVVFKFYSRHKRLGNVMTDVPRCCICGASARIALTKEDRFFRVH